MKKKEAIKILKDFHDKSALFSIRTALETLHPEFKESEDELTWLKKYIEEEAYSLSMDIRGSEDRIKLKKLQKSLAWLEKQGESNPYSGVSFEYNGHAYEMCARNNGVEILIDCKLKAFVSLDKSFVYPDCPQPILTPKSALEAIKEDKIDNQNCVKPIVEPKFKVGDWIINTESGYIRQILKINNGCYETDYGVLPVKDYESIFRLWTIQNAKKGEVLALSYASQNYVFIYKGLYEKSFKTIMSVFCFYCVEEDTYYDETDSFHVMNHGEIITPATKEQRELLFQKMREAGYEWDSEKKELKEIEQKPAWSEEDDVRLQACIDALQTKSICGKVDTIMTKWLKSLKQRIGG